MRLVLSIKPLKGVLEDCEIRFQRHTHSLLAGPEITCRKRVERPDSGLVAGQRATETCGCRECFTRGPVRRGHRHVIVQSTTVDSIVAGQDSLEGFVVSGIDGTANAGCSNKRFNSGVHDRLNERIMGVDLFPARHFKGDASGAACPPDRRHRSYSLHSCREQQPDLDGVGRFCRDDHRNAHAEAVA